MSDPPHAAPPKTKLAPLVRKRSLVGASLALLLLMMLSFIGFRLLQDEALATLTDFSGQPQRDRAKRQGQWHDAAQGDHFHDGDGARTQDSAQAHFRLLGGARMRLSPNSLVRFQRHHQGGALRVDVEW